MAEGLAAMSPWVEAEIVVERVEAAAKDWHLFRRRSQRLAGPQAGVDANARDLALVADRNDDQVERDAAMNARLALGFGEQRNVAALLEIAHGVDWSGVVGREPRDAEDAERVRRLLARLLGVI